MLIPKEAGSPLRVGEKTLGISQMSFLKVTLSLIVLGTLVIPLGYLVWTFKISPMKSVACTVVKHEVLAVDPSPRKVFPGKLTIHFEYQYEGSNYVSVSSVGDFENKEKLEWLLKKSPIGSQHDCWVDSNDPTKLVKFPFPYTVFYGAILGGVGLLVFCGSWTFSWLFPLGLGRDPKTTIEKISQSEVKHRIEKRFQASLQELKLLGFKEYCFYWEISAPFYLISNFVMFLAMCTKKEVIEIRSSLRIARGYPLLELPNQGTFAVVHALESQFLTLFTDGTLLMTGTEGRIKDFVDENFQVHRQGATQTVEAAWGQHQIRVESFKAEGKRLKENINFSDYADIFTIVKCILLAHNFFRNPVGWDGMMG